MQSGGLVLSFDFELAWGLRQSSEPISARLATQYAHVGSVVVNRLLEILERYELSATWGTVGHLMVRKEDCTAGRFPYPSPELAPRYRWFEGDWLDGIPTCESESASAYYAPEAVQAILDCPVHQELASHTFTHAPLGDPGCSAEFARWDLATCQTLAARWGRQLTSVIFPRNEIGHLPVLRELGYRTFRGANSEWYWFGRANQLHRRRALRYGVWLLRYFDEWSAHTPPLLPIRQQNGLWEVPHSMFFPGLRGVSQFITPDQRVRRAVKGLQAAAERGKVFSLWTHPHNFLPQPELLLPAWETICRTAAELRDQGRLQVLTMEQLADGLDAGDHRAWLAE
jgi:hypothetical protein